MVGNHSSNFLQGHTRGHGTSSGYCQLQYRLRATPSALQNRTHCFLERDRYIYISDGRNVDHVYKKDKAPEQVLAIAKEEG